MSRPGLFAAGGFHNLVVTEKGDLLSWGGNDYGQLGDGTVHNRPAAVRIREGDVHGVGAGHLHSLLITEAGDVWAWGFNEDGILLGGNMPARQTTPIKVIEGGVASVDGGRYHSLALTSTGEVWSWGGNKYGQLGDGTLEARSSPSKIIGGGISAIGAGWYHSVVLAEGGEVLIWGLAASAQTCHAPATNPILVDMGGANVNSISVGAFHNLAITSDGTLLAWGSNDCGQLGDGCKERPRGPDTAPDGTHKRGKRRFEPYEVLRKDLSPLKVKHASAGEKHSVVVTELSEIYAWGYFLYGDPRDAAGEWKTMSRPEFIDFHGGAHSTSCGQVHTLILNHSGEVYSWGSSQRCQAGDGQKERHWPFMILCGGTVEIVPLRDQIEQLLKGPKDIGEAALKAQETAGLRGGQVTYVLAQPGQLGPRTGQVCLEPSESHLNFWGTTATQRLMDFREADLPMPNPPPFAITNDDAGIPPPSIYKHATYRKLMTAGAAVVTSATPVTPGSTLSIGDREPSSTRLALTDQRGSGSLARSPSAPAGTFRATNEWTTQGFVRPGQPKPGRSNVGISTLTSAAFEKSLEVPELLQTMEKGESDLARKRRERQENKRAARAAQAEEAAYQAQLARVKRAMLEDPRLQLMRITPPERVQDLPPYSDEGMLSMAKSVMGDILSTSMSLLAGESKWIKDKAIYSLSADVWKPIIIIRGMMITHWPRSLHTAEPYQTIEESPCRLMLMGRDDIQWDVSELEDMRFISENKRWQPIPRSAEWLLTLFGTTGTRSTFPQPYGPDAATAPPATLEGPKTKGPPPQPPMLLQTMSAMGLGSGATHRQATRFKEGKMGVTSDEYGFVQEVSADGPSHTKGIKRGDQIVKVGAEPFSQDALARAENCGFGYEVTVSRPAQLGMNIDHLLHQLKDPRKAMRWAALDRLCRIVALDKPGAKACDEIYYACCKLLDDEDRDVRKRATEVVPKVAPSHRK